MTSNVNAMEVDGSEIAKSLFGMGGILFMFGLGRWLNDRKEKGDRLTKLETKVALMESSVNQMSKDMKGIAERIDIEMREVRQDMHELDTDMKRVRMTNHEMIIGINLILSELQIEYNVEVGKKYPNLFK